MLEHLLDKHAHRLDVLVELALDEAPEMLAELLPRALRARWDAYRRTTAAVLALLDTPWSRHVLGAALESTDTWCGSAQYRAALDESRDEGAR